jgi:hypothetical protein
MKVLNLKKVPDEMQKEELMTIKLTNQDLIDLGLPLLQMLTEIKMLKNQLKKDSHLEEKMDIILLKDILKAE